MRINTEIFPTEEQDMKIENDGTTYMVITPETARHLMELLKSGKGIFDVYAFGSFEWKVIEDLEMLETYLTVDNDKAETGKYYTFGLYVGIIGTETTFSK